ncbi:MAG: response regulator [Bacteriovoracaceae bacterium]
MMNQSPKGNILIVDDNVELLEKLQFLLEDLAEEIFIAEDAAKGYDAIQNHEKLHCVVCDINMPGKDGVEFLKDVRAAGIKIPFVFFTGHGDDDLMVKAGDLGTYDFIMKPQLDNLEKAVIEAMKIGQGITSGDEHTSEEKFQELVDILKK